jgi:hypothetical protein
MRAEPRWPAVIAVLAVGGIYLAIPEYLSLGPRWLLLAVMIAITIPLLAMHRAGLAEPVRWLGIVSNSILTVALVWSLILLVQALPARKEPPGTLLRSAGGLWISNILVFALWYWRFDAGGPGQRETRDGHHTEAFLFPNSMMQEVERHESHRGNWSPNFLDYLFVAFNTSTAFSPTDTAPVARWAKALMMLQSLISLTIVVLLAARAVNVL